MTLSSSDPLLSAADYLAMDRAAELKSEFVDGRVVAMSGGSRDHSRIKLNLAWIACGQLEDGDCEAFDSDLRVRIDAQRYAYPDLSVVCGESRFADERDDILLNPTLVVEVLSPSTEATDRGEKWARYRRMDSLRGYLLVSQDQALLELFTRRGDLWTFREARGLGARLEIPEVGRRIALADLYARVDLDES